MSSDVRNQLNYIAACVSEFAERHGLTLRDTYFYLRDHSGIQFLQNFYDVKHTLSFEEAVVDLTRVCARNRGTLV